jgi:hypothetical protein
MSLKNCHLILLDNLCTDNDYNCEKANNSIYFEIINIMTR